MGMGKRSEGQETGRQRQETELRAGRELEDQERRAEEMRS